MQEIDIVIENGEIKLRTKGFKGKACMETAEKLLQKLKEFGVQADTTKLDKTSEFYEIETVKERVRK